MGLWHLGSPARVGDASMAGRKHRARTSTEASFRPFAGRSFAASTPRFGLIVVTCAALILLTPASVPFVSTLNGSSIARGRTPARKSPSRPKVRVAVDRGLEWLRRHQQSDGSWPAGASSTTAIPSLAVMAFLARGHTPGQGRYGDLLDRAIDYVLDSQQNDGLLSRAVRQRDHVRARHQHGDARRGLRHGGRPPEAPHRAPEMAKAVQLILDAQKVEKGPAFAGGWRYQRGSRDSDISVSGWQLMALRAAANCAAVPRGAGGRRRIYPQQRRPRRRLLLPARRPAQRRPQRHRDPRPRTARREELPRGPPGRRLPHQERPTPNNAEFYYYAVYYVCQAVNQLGGKYGRGLPKVRDGDLALQEDDGSFASAASPTMLQARPTAPRWPAWPLCVPYRYLPLYQR